MYTIYFQISLQLQNKWCQNICNCQNLVINSIVPMTMLTVTVTYIVYSVNVIPYIEHPHNKYHNYRFFILHSIIILINDWSSCKLYYLKSTPVPKITLRKYIDLHGLIIEVVTKLVSREKYEYSLRFNDRECFLILHNLRFLIVKSITDPTRLD